MQCLSARVTVGVGAGESASARPERTAGREPGGKTKNLSSREAGRALYSLSAPETRWLYSPAVAEGSGAPAGGRGAGTRRAAAAAAAGPSTRVSQCEAAGGRRAAGGRVCAGGGGARAPPGPWPSQPPGLGACLPPARTGCPPPPLLLAPALHGSLPAVSCFVLPSEDGSDLFLIGRYLKGGSVPYFLLAWRNGGRIHPYFPKPGRIL